MSKNILIIEDDIDLAELVKIKLKKENYITHHINEPVDITSQVQKINPDLILLDLMIDEWDGFDICREIKSNNDIQNIPIIFLTGKSEVINVVTGLELGAEDYIIKPFSMDVLIARIRKVFRKDIPNMKMSKTVSFDTLTIDLDKHEVFIDKKEISLNHTEFKLLAYISKKPGWVYNRIQLIDAIRGNGYIVTDRIIDVIIVSLRKKLKQYGKCIQTIRGVGYRFKVN